MVNLVNLDNNPDDRYDNRKPPGKVDTEKPKKGIDDQVAFNLAGRSPRESTTTRKAATLGSIKFHELAEAYAKVEHSKQYNAAHREAESREYRLREQRPNLGEHNLGSGHFADKQIIRR